MTRRAKHFVAFVWIATVASAAPALAQQTRDIRPRAVADARVTVSLGAVEISTFNLVTITGLEESTNIYFDLRNTGSTPVTLAVPNAQKLPTVAFSVLPIMGFQANEMTLAPGETRVAEYMVGRQGTGTASIDFKFELVGASQTIPIEIRALGTPSWGSLSNSATVTGTATVSGTPPPNIDVIVWSFSNRGFYRGRTDSAGRYSVNVPAISEITDALGPRRFPYPTLSYFVYADAAGYSLGYADAIAPARGETVVRNLVLARLSLPTYNLVAEVKTDGLYGYFWMGANAAFNRFAAAQGQHPPELRRPAHIIMVDELGNTVWRKETGDECWGFDFVLDRVVAGCHDGQAHVLDVNGPLLWSRQFGVPNRAVQFSPDGTRLLSGPDNTGPGNSNLHDAVMFNAATGQQLWAFDGGIGYPLRTIRFNTAGDRIAAGFSAGILTVLNSSGAELWRRYIGEFPMMLEFDAQNNLYAVGKNEEVFSYDSAGGLRWRSRVLGPAKAGILNMSAGSDQFVTSTNTRDGGLLWKHTAADRRPAGSYAIPQQGASSVVVSEDGSTIAAAYSDSVIRIFRRSDAGGPGNLVATSLGSAVTLTWSAPSTGTAPNTYVIEAGSAAALSDLASFSTGTAATSFSANGIAAGTYYVRVRAGSASGAASNEAVLVVGGACTTAPSAPANLSMVSVSGGTVVLSWTAASGGPATYVVEAGSGPGQTNLANLDLGSPATSMTAPGVPGGTYYVRMRARNACGLAPRRASWC